MIELIKEVAHNAYPCVFTLPLEFHQNTAEGA